MLEELDKLKAILQERLSDDDKEVETLLAELTIAADKGSVSIEGDATESIILTGDKNIIGDNNQVIINNNTDPELIRQIIHSISRNIKSSSSRIANRKNCTVRGKNAANNPVAVAKYLSVKKTTPSKKKPNTTLISKNIIILNRSRSSVPAKLAALKELGRDAKGDNSAIVWILSLIQRRNESNDVIAAGITALSKISDDRSTIVSAIIGVLRVNQNSSVVISA
jgi:hypothetical protein